MKQNKSCRAFYAVKLLTYYEKDYEERATGSRKNANNLPAAVGPRSRTCGTPTLCPLDGVLPLTRRTGQLPHSIGRARKKT